MNIPGPGYGSAVEEIEGLRAENARLNAMLDQVEKMGCLYKGNFTGCPGCFVGLERERTAAEDSLSKELK